MNDLVRYPFGTLSKSFYSGLPFGLFMSFPPPSHLIHIKDKERRERKDKKIREGSNRGIPKELFLTISFFYSACGPRKAMHSEGTGGVEF
jgi:hypothetical protein